MWEKVRGVWAMSYLHSHYVEADMDSGYRFVKLVF